MLGCRLPSNSSAVNLLVENGIFLDHKAAYLFLPWFKRKNVLCQNYYNTSKVTIQILAAPRKTKAKY